MNRGDGAHNGRHDRHLRRWLPAGGSVAFLWLVALGCSANNGSFLPDGPAASTPDGSTATVEAGSPGAAAPPDAARAPDAGLAADSGHPADSGSPGDAASPPPDSGSAGGSTCMDGVEDGDETGADCGGSCPPCVPYSIGSPNTDDKVGNACAGGGDVSFICPRFMLLSSEMREAAAADESANGWPAGAFNYGVATLNGAACCACYQIVYGAPQDGQLAYTPPRPLIIQNFNTGGAPGAFDVFMGKGGEGANTTGCSALYTSYPTIGEPNGGGINAAAISACGTTTAGLESSGCVSTVTSECDTIQAASSYVETTTQFSCIEANSGTSAYHANWSVKAREVECPAALTEVTGCKLNPGGNPQPDPTVQTVAEASSWSAYSTTTMEDCCKPSCAWAANVSNTESPWSAMYQCDGSGNPMHN
jgi:hypothetical protein